MTPTPAREGLPELLREIAAWHRRMNLELSDKGSEWAAKEMYACPHGRFATALEAIASQPTQGELAAVVAHQVNALRALAAVIRNRGTCPPAALEQVADYLAAALPHPQPEGGPCCQFGNCPYCSEATLPPPSDGLQTKPATECRHDWATDGGGDYCRYCKKREDSYSPPSDAAQGEIPRHSLLLKVGDKVRDRERSDWSGVVEVFGGDCEYPFKVGERTYTADGRYNYSIHHPSDNDIVEVNGRPVIDTPPSQPVRVDELPTRCDGKEQEAFEAWARSQRYDMTTHPLHWLFLNDRTYAARQGWAAALTYVSETVRAHKGEGNG